MPPRCAGASILALREHPVCRAEARARARAAAGSRARARGRSPGRGTAVRARPRHDRPALLQRAGPRARRGRAHLQGDGRQRQDLRAACRRRLLDRRDARPAARGGAAVPEHADPGVPAQQRFGHRPADRLAAGARRDRGVDRRRHVLPERADSRAGGRPRHRPGRRPGRRGAHVRGGDAQGAAGARQVVHPQGRRAAHQHQDPRPELGAARVPPRGVAALPAAAAARVLLRHHDHDRVPVEPAPGPVHADRLRQAGRASRSSTSPRTPTATSCRCCGW